MRNINITLSAPAIEILRKLAKVSKMDCWFSIDDNGVITDLEDNNTVMNTSEAIYMLLDGASSQDFEHLDDVEMRTLVLMLSNIVKQLVND